ncbi:unnamed protein product [Ceutorhynchus assimilis]|uniref:Uncharacterized protein n=1 Tax=Ceutorhynchus assimilis TaxID=467358 RepID=A0A9N9QL56_9CUCU|nr:unnamed protein product [Ceutorhynchus assimilis]
MHYFSLLIILISTNSYCFCMIYKSNFTDLWKCQVSYSRTGSTYKDFYPVDVNENASLYIDFHFGVLASSDAHILLTASENVSKTDPVYEIVIGAGGNTFCDIRRMQKSDVRHSVRIKGLLSALDPSLFWLHITHDAKGGLIEVGREGENTSFIDWLDPELLPIRFISFSTWSGIEAKWYFNCDRSQSQEEIEKKMTAFEKLRRNLLTAYDPRAKNDSNVYMTVNVNYIKLNDYNPSIEIHATTSMTWHDEKLMWNSTLYDNISTFHALDTEIWKPEIKCFSVSNLTQSPTVIFASNQGEVNWNPDIHIQSICESAKLNNWPRDVISCKIIFGFSNGKILLDFNNTGSNLFLDSTNDWFILEATVFDIETKNVSKYLTPSFGFYFKLKRSSVSYNIIFFAPFIMISICLLLSFWVPPKRHMKLSLGGSQLVLGIISLLALAYFVPHTSNEVPFLVKLYGSFLIGSSISLIISIIIIQISCKRHSKPLHHFICKILTNKYVKIGLWLPNFVRPEDYGDLDISLSCTNLSRQEDNNKDQQYWTLLAIAIDRLSFLIYFPVIFIIIIKYIVSCL